MKESFKKNNSQSDGSDLIGSNTPEAEEDGADPSNEADDCSC